MQILGPTQKERRKKKTNIFGKRAVKWTGRVGRSDEKSQKSGLK